MAQDALLTVVGDGDPWEALDTLPLTGYSEMQSVSSGFCSLVIRWYTLEEQARVSVH